MELSCAIGGAETSYRDAKRVAREAGAENVPDRTVIQKRLDETDSNKRPRRDASELVCPLTSTLAPVTPERDHSDRAGGANTRKVRSWDERNRDLCKKAEAKEKRSSQEKECKKAEIKEQHKKNQREKERATHKHKKHVGSSSIVVFPGNPKPHNDPGFAFQRPAYTHLPRGTTACTGFGGREAGVAVTQAHADTWMMMFERRQKRGANGTVYSYEKEAVAAKEVKTERVENMARRG